MKGKVMINFPPEYAVTETGVNFPVLVGKRRAVCSITFEALQDRFQVIDKFESGFNENRNQINNLVRILIESNPDDDKYLITTTAPQ